MFDVDKLNIYWRIDKTDPKSVLLNRLLRIESDILLHPRNAHQLFLPVVDDIFAQDAYNKIYVDLEGNPKNESPSWFNSMLPQTNVDKSLVFVKGKLGVGIVALDITGHSVFQVDDISMNTQYFDAEEESTKSTKLLFEGFENNYSLSNYFDSDDNIISEVESQLLSTQVDNVKNPVGIKLGINMQTLNIVGYLLRRGVAPNTIIKFIKQPIIQKYLENQRINESFSNKTNGQELNKEKLFEKTLKQFGVGRSELPVVITNDMLESGIVRDANKNPRDKSNSAALLQYFIELQQQAKALSYFSRDQNADTKSLKNRQAYELMLENYASAIESNIIDAEAYNKIRQNGFLSEFTKARELYGDLFKDFYATITSKYSPYLNEFKTVLAKLKKSATDKEKIMNTVENDFILYFIHKYALQGQFNVLFGKNDNQSLASRVKQIKDTNSNLSNNILIKAFFPLLSNRKDEVDGKYLDNIRLFERELANSDVNDMIDAAKEVAEINPKIYSDIVKFLFFQSGFNNSPFNYSKIIPVGKNSDKTTDNSYMYEFATILNDGIKSMKNSDIESEFNQFIEEFVKNNPWVLRKKAFKGYLKEFPSISKYTYRFDKTSKSTKLYNSDTESFTPTLGSTFHKHYGLPFVSVEQPLPKTEPTDKNFPTSEFSIGNNSLTDSLYKDFVKYGTEYVGKDIEEFVGENEYYKYLVNKLIGFNPDVRFEFFNNKRKFTDSIIRENTKLGNRKGMIQVMDMVKNNADIRGVYMSNINKIMYSPFVDNRTLVHELVHATVQKEYNKQSDFYDKINKLYEYADKQFGTESKVPYGFYSPTEFLAEALSNPEFMQILNDIPYQESNVFTKLMDLISNFINSILGTDINPDSVLAEVVKQTEAVININQQEISKLDGRGSSDILEEETVTEPISFDILMPEYDYFSLEEKEIAMKLINKGEVQLTCRF
jgi:hypothetical protein